MCDCVNDGSSPDPSVLNFSGFQTGNGLLGFKGRGSGYLFSGSSGKSAAIISAQALRSFRIASGV